MLGFDNQLVLGKFSVYVRLSCSNFNDMIFEKADGSEFIKLHSNKHLRFDHSQIISQLLGNEKLIILDIEYYI